MTDLRKLRHVTVLARLRSYTKAAEELGLSQPALTRSIQAIEREMGAPLFDRDRGGVHPTALGRVVSARAQTLLHDLADLDLVVKRSVTGAGGEVAFGISHGAAHCLLPKLLSDQLVSQPDLRTHAWIRGSEALLTLLLEEKLEFFLGTDGRLPPSRFASVTAVPMGDFPISLMVRKGHPLLDPTSKAQPSNFPLIAAGRFDLTAAFPDYFRPYLTRPISVAVQDCGILARITETSDAVWLDSPFVLSAGAGRGVLEEIRPPEGKERIRLPMTAYSLARRTLSPAARRIQQQLRLEIRRLNATAALR